jgi:catechol 2,3-dioxygenase-like lactoylglutathione lyase family enzyme
MMSRVAFIVTTWWPRMIVVAASRCASSGASVLVTIGERSPSDGLTISPAMLRWPDMAQPNTLIFVDLPSDDPEASGRFYAEVFGWEVEGRPAGSFHRIVPGGHFPLPDGSPSPIGNLHMGIFNAANARPHPDPAGVEPRTLSRDGRSARVWILVADDDSDERILDTAVRLGATELWRHHYWAEFNGFNSAFMDPWGNTLVLWTKGGSDPVVPKGWTRE